MSEVLQKKAAFVYAVYLIAMVNRPATTLRTVYIRGGTHIPEWPALSMPGTCKGLFSTETVPF